MLSRFSNTMRLMKPNAYLGMCKRYKRTISYKKEYKQNDKILSELKEVKQLIKEEFVDLNNFICISIACTWVVIVSWSR